MRILKSFLIAWFCYWLLQVILPVSPVGNGMLVGFLVQATFVLVVAATYTLMECLAVDVNRSGRVWQANRTVIVAALTLSVLGTLALGYDKIIVQGIDYSAGLAMAREQWREVGAMRGNEVSSPASAVGYLLSSCYIVAIVLLTRDRFAATWKTIACAAVAAALAMANTVLTGGRSTLILTLLFYIAARLMAPDTRASQAKVTGPRKSLWVTLLLVLLGGIYFLFIFLQRAEAAGISVASYSAGVLADLGLQPSEWLSDFNPDSLVGALVNLLVTAVAYFTHSFATTVSIVDFGPSHNQATVVFVTAAGLAAKLHLIEPIDTDWFLAGAFPSLPGALYLQGGWFLLVMASAVLGLLTSLAQSWYRASPSTMSFGVLTAFLCVLLSSPILFVADVMMFPFVICQFGLIYLIAKIIK